MPDTYTEKGYGQCERCGHWVKGYETYINRDGKSEVLHWSGWGHPFLKSGDERGLCEACFELIMESKCAGSFDICRRIEEYANENF